MLYAEEAYMGQDVSAALETEALQTDIQRFIAIIGFCLMAVFALVQSIPVTDPDLDRSLDDLKRKFFSQRERLEDLMSENQRLKMETDILITHSRATRELSDELRAARAALERQKTQMEQMARESVSRVEKLSQYQAALRERDRRIEALEADRDRVKNTLERVLRTQNHQTVKPSTVESAAEKRGSHVAFESDLVFMALLRSGKIELFIKIEGMDRGFKVLNGRDGIAFAPGRRGSGIDLWAIEDNTVPSAILKAFDTWTALSSRKKRFLVGLPPPISRPIRARGKENGRFLIKDGGAVVFTSNGG